MSIQPSLFPSPRTPFQDRLIPGLIYQTDFISIEEEAALLRRFLDLPFETFKFRGVEASRRNLAYGWKYNFMTRAIDPAPPIPAWLLDIRERVGGFTGQPGEAYRQALIIEYPRGPGIGWHRDRPEFGDVVGISLGAAAPLRFRRRDGDRWKRAVLELRRRSLYAMAGDAGNAWEHNISQIDKPRFSLTFRTISDTFERGNAPAVAQAGPGTAMA